MADLCLPYQTTGGPLLPGVGKDNAGKHLHRPGNHRNGNQDGKPGLALQHLSQCGKLDEKDYGQREHSEGTHMAVLHDFEPALGRPPATEAIGSIHQPIIMEPSGRPSGKGQHQAGTDGRRQGQQRDQGIGKPVEKPHHRKPVQAPSLATRPSRNGKARKRPDGGSQSETAQSTWPLMASGMPAIITMTLSARLAIF